eukprot:CAMPEP_0184649978 /NCGR_PEP_ID=MMETSP0308-20130426/7447_1 /TAXON_ID=38269 /ORGANISM="Gloeochaete witrockiana, Strain SAG 46.84" /LENGTH=120 /DNA_ID=CAMNT_0027083151 /DNA_START=252 /DNA_END=614 /DNA_ORIENTATION=+
MTSVDCRELSPSFSADCFLGALALGLWEALFVLGDLTFFDLGEEIVLLESLEVEERRDSSFLSPLPGDLGFFAACRAAFRGRECEVEASASLFFRFDLSLVAEEEPACERGIFETVFAIA